jgi:hypothetical protein
MKDKKKKDFEFGSSTEWFGREVIKAIIEHCDPSEYEGIGGHDLQYHHGGWHTQISIGLGGYTLNFRFYEDDLEL